VADEMDDEQRANQTMLIAFLTAHLESGESFELLPVADAQDVKGKVKELLEDWAKSGFLVEGDQFYPWHRVKRVVATKVDELSPADWQQQKRAIDDTSRQRTSFWKTKKAREKKKDDDEGGAPPMAH
jgi:hypothetical protein